MRYMKASVLMKNQSLRTERKRQGLTQAKLARVLGVSTKTVVRWEQGRCVPFPYHRQKLSILFGKTAQELGLSWKADEKKVLEEVYQVPLKGGNTRNSMLFLCDQCGETQAEEYLR